MDAKVTFNGCGITREADNGVKTEMTRCILTIEAIKIDEKLKGNGPEKANQEEITAYRKPAGELVWFGTGALPQKPSLDLQCKND